MTAPERLSLENESEARSKIVQRHIPKGPKPEKFRGTQGHGRPSVDRFLSAMPTSRRHILLVENDRDIQTAFVALFERVEHYALHLAPGIRHALGITGLLNVDVAIVDLAHGAELPARLDVIRAWRRDGLSFPVIVTSLHDDVGLLVETFEAGGDDFLRKPYLFEELRARIQRQLVRRLTTIPRTTRIDGVPLPDEPFTFAGATISPDLRITFRHGAVFRLTAKQFGILREFSRSVGNLVLKERLIYAVWGADANTNSASVHQYLHVLRTLYRAGGIDLNAFVAAESKAGWRIYDENTTRLDLCGKR